MAEVIRLSREDMAEKHEEAVRESYAETEKAIDQISQRVQSQRQFSNLASYIRSCWNSARSAKMDIQKELYESALQRRGEYTPQKLNEIKQLPGSTVFMNITSVKCRAAEAWIDDSLGHQDTQIWDIKPTPIPDLPPHIKEYIEKLAQFRVSKNPLLFQTIESQKEFQDYLISNTHIEMQKQAELAAERMRFKIEDQLIEANWVDALKEVISDVITYKAGFLKGPIVRRKLTLKWEHDERTGTWNPKIEPRLVVNYERISPFDIYPAPSATGINTGFLIEHHRLIRQDLVDLIGVPGYHTPTIRKVLKEYGSGGLRDWVRVQSLKEEAEGRKDIESASETPSPDKTIDALEFWGDAPGRLLLEWGLKTDAIDDPDKEYHISAWLIGEYVIKATLNQHPTGNKPYYKTSFENIPGSFWGRGVPEIMKDIQAVCNATARALINNLSISSAPQTMVDVNQLASGQNIEEMYPWKLWYIDTSTAGLSKNRAIEFFQPNSNADQLLRVYQYYKKEADEHTGIPSYTYGSPDVGAGARTATGLSILMSNAAKGIRFAISNIDFSIIRPSIDNLYTFNMLYDEDASIKGDLQVVTKGALSLIQKETTAVRRVEMLNTLATNPVYLEVIGKRGISNLLREVIGTLDMPTESIVPSEQDIESQDIQKQIILQLQQGLMAIQQGQITPDEFVATLIQLLGIQAPEQSTKGTPQKPATLMPSGERAGGIDTSLYVKQKQ